MDVFAKVHNLQLYDGMVMPVTNMVTSYENAFVFLNHSEDECTFNLSILSHGVSWKAKNLSIVSMTVMPDTVNPELYNYDITFKETGSTPHLVRVLFQCQLSFGNLLRHRA